MNNKGSSKPLIFKKKLGQHFLRDQGTIFEIINLVQPRPEDLILEIGAGDSALTKPLALSGAQITAIEIDRELTDQLGLLFDKMSNVEVLNQDILHFDFPRLKTRNKKWKIVGNLPYNISTQLILKLLHHRELFSLITVMVQKEVGDRLLASPGNKSYGRLSVMTQRLASMTWCLDVTPDKFFPIPKVWSSIIQIEPKTVSLNPNLESYFQNTVREAFSHRRKTLSNSLKALLTSRDIEAVGIDPLARAEQLGIEEFEALAKVVQDKKTRINS